MFIFIIPERPSVSFKYKVGEVPVMTILSLTSILFVSILIDEVKVGCFVSKSAWVIVEPVEEIVFPERLMFVPAIKVLCFCLVEYLHILLKRVCLVNLLQLVILMF
jgi:hypothetical protein